MYVVIRVFYIAGEGKPNLSEGRVKHVSFSAEQVLTEGKRGRVRTLERGEGQAC